ncbi:alpha/beta fold hydrolase [Minwuia sp.]|uniref:alpha/beta fold hydrolase n=1 Tax=Minwuia sp. TaxID=2493630 RepID=UPI003A902622
MSRDTRRLSGSFGEIAYFDVGGDRRPLLMLHASGTGPATLLKLAEAAVEAGRRVIIPGFDGYGGTHIENGDDAIARHRTVVETMLDHMAEPVDVFGHSMGGLLSLTVARTVHPLIRSVTAVEPVAIGVLRAHPDDAEALAADVDAVSRIGPAMDAGRPEDALRDFIGLWNGQDWDTIPPRMREGILRLAPQIRNDTSSVSFLMVGADAYRTISCPVHLIATGRGPETAKAVIRRLREANPAWTSSIVEEAGHMGPIEVPGHFAAFIR